VIVPLEAALCLASGRWRLLKPFQRNADGGCDCARGRIAQRIEDLFRCVAGLLRSVRDQARPGAGAFRSRCCHFRSGLGQLRFGMALSRAKPPSSCAMVVNTGADLVKDGAGLMKVGDDQGKDARY
jgi:hypothetical protein